MAVLKDLIVHGSSRFLNGIQANSLKANTIDVTNGYFKYLKAIDGDIENLSVEDLLAQKATVVGLLDVKGELHTNSWTNTNIANIGGVFYISPTVISTTATVVIGGSANSRTLTVSSGSFATTTVPTWNGTTESTSGWVIGSRVMVTGSVTYNNVEYPLGTCVGYISGALSSTGFTMQQINSEALEDIFAVVGTNSLAGSNIQLSMYEIGPGNNSNQSNTASYKPVGILMTSYGMADKSTHIDIYGGVNAKNTSSKVSGMADPNVRIGYLGGLDSYTDSAGNTRTPMGWGIYTDNGFFKGVVVADSGSIGNFTIDSNAIYSGEHSAYNTSGKNGIFIGRPNSSSSDYYVSGGPGAQWYLKSDGSAKIGAMTLSAAGVLAVPAANITGTLTASQIDVSGVISSGSIVTNTLTGGTFNTADYIRVSTQASSSLAIGTSGAKTDWRIIAGKTFGVDKAGNVYATSANISGTITATDGTIGGCSIVNGTLQIANANISEAITVGNLDLEIGGNNLFKDSANLINGWVLSNATVSDGIVTINSNASSGEKRIYQLPANGYWTFQANQYYTVSVDAKGDSNTSKFVFSAVGGGGLSKGFTLTTDWKRYTWTFKPTSVSTSSFSFYGVDNTGTIYLRKPKLEYGNKATDWTPAPEDLMEMSNWYATCDTAAATVAKVATITPTTDSFVLKEGATVNVKIITTNSGAVGNLTLNVNETGAKNIKFINNNGVPANIPGASYLVGGNTYQFVYDGTYWVIQNLNYNTNDVDRKRINNVIKVGENITQYCIAGQVGTSGYKKLTSGVVIDLSYPMAYLASGNISGQSYAIASGNTATTFYTAMPSVNLQYTKASWTGTQYLMCYIKGTLSGNSFTVHSDVFTTTVPTTEDGFYYIPIGILYSTYQVNFDCRNQLYCYKDGAFGPTSTRESSEAAKTATNYITNIDANGIWVTPSGKKPTDTSTGAGATGTRINGDGMQIFNAGTQIASYGSAVTIGQTGSGKFNTYIDGNGIYMRKATTKFSEFTGSAVKFYDGSGVAATNITAQFSSDGAVVGKTSSYHTALSSTGMLVYDGSGNATTLIDSNGFYTTGDFQVVDSVLNEQKKSYATINSTGTYLGYKYQGLTMSYALDLVGDSGLTFRWRSRNIFKLDDNNGLQLYRIPSDSTPSQDISVKSTQVDSNGLFLYDYEVIPGPPAATYSIFPYVSLTKDLIQMGAEKPNKFRTTINSSGLTIIKRDSNGTDSQIANFGATTTIGKTTESHMNLDYHSLQLIDKESNTYFEVKDLRDTNGVATLTHYVIADGFNRWFQPTLKLYQEVSVEVYETGDPLEGDPPDTGYSAQLIDDPDRPYYEITPTPPEGAKVVIRYKTQDENAKGFTFGQRQNADAIGPYSTATGLLVDAYGVSSHAEGMRTIASNYCSHAEGEGSKALNYSSHAEGIQTISRGQASHAEGIDTVASGHYSHAEGGGTLASGGEAHAEGGSSKATGTNSHAEGGSTLASGGSSHAEGDSSVASQFAAHAEGSGSVASGFRSHAQNNHTVATESDQTVIGKYNKATVSGDGTTSSPYSYTNVGDYAFIIGNGSSNTTANRSNALTVDWSGNVNIASGAKYKINGTALSASDVGAVPTTRKVNNKALSSDITLSASDVSAVPTSDVTTSGEFGKIPKMSASGVLDIGAYIDFHASGGASDYDVRLQANAASSTGGGFLHINGQPMKDFIIDNTTATTTGAATSWTVRKWNSGYCEAFAMTSSSNYAMTTAYTNGFYCTVTQALPSNLFTSVNYGQVSRCNGTSHTGLITASLYNLTTTQVQWFAFDTKSETVNCSFVIRIVGKWK